MGWGGAGGLIMTRRISHDVGTGPWTLHVGLKLTWSTSSGGRGDTDKAVNNGGGGGAPAPQGVADNTASASRPLAGLEINEHIRKLDSTPPQGRRIGKRP